MNIKINNEVFSILKKIFEIWYVFCITVYLSWDRPLFRWSATTCKLVVTILDSVVLEIAEVIHFLS